MVYLTEPNHDLTALLALKLGRLDGRLQNSPCTDIWLARARLNGAAELARLAGSLRMPVAEFQNLMAGRTLPPRVQKDLNGAIPVAAVFHIALSRDESILDPVAGATLNILRTVLVRRANPNVRSKFDMLSFGPMWQRVRDATDAPLARRDLQGIAERVLEISEIISRFPVAEADVTSLDGRKMSLQLQGCPPTCLIGAEMPRLLRRAGLTLRNLPSLVLLPSLLPASSEELANVLLGALDKSVSHGLRDLNAIELAMHRAKKRFKNKRSKAMLFDRLDIAYPGLTALAAERLLGINKKTARKLAKPVTTEAGSRTECDQPLETGVPAKGSLF